MTKLGSYVIFVGIVVMTDDIVRSEIVAAKCPTNITQREPLSPHRLKPPSSFCSPWVYCDNGTCRCGEVPNRMLKCSVGTNTSILGNNCLTYNEESCLSEIGRCIYSITNGKILYFTIPKSTPELNEFMCGQFNRAGTLCGRCKDEHYSQVYSYDVNCIKCPNGKANLWKYLLAAYFPLTVFYFAVLIFKINVASSRLYPFVIYSQVVSLPIIVRVELMYVKNNALVESVVRWISMLYGFWNLDFFRTFDLGICLGTDTLQTMALDIAVGIYPLFLMVPTCLLIRLYDSKFKPFVVIWKPFQVITSFFHNNLEIRTSMVDAFCTFLLLSNSKLLSSSFDLLVPVSVYQLNATGHLAHSWRLYSDPTVGYFGNRHLPYAVLAIVVLVVFAIFPVLLLIIYPLRWFQKFLNIFPVRWLALHTFMDAFQGCYKDGTEPGTRDFRWFVSILLIARFILLVVGVYTFSSAYFPVATMVLVTVVILYIAFDPFKPNFANNTWLHIMFALLHALGYTSAIGNTNLTNMLFPFLGILSIVAFLPLLYISAIILHWVYCNRTFGMNIVRRIQAWKRGYESIQ